VAGVLGVEQRGRLTPDAVAVPVEAERGDLVDGVARRSSPINGTVGYWNCLNASSGGMGAGGAGSRLAWRFVT
jgi:hypothetical protein